MSNMNPLARAVPFSQYAFSNEEHMVSVSMESMPFTIAYHFSKCIMLYSSKTANHILRIMPFDVGSSPLEKYCDLKNAHP